MLAIQRFSLILLPGLDGTGILFKPFVAALPREVSPVVLQYPGDRHLTYPELLAEVKKALPREGRYIVLGESFSGPLAAMVAAERPAGLAGMILCASFVTAPRRFVRPAVPLLARPFPFRIFPRLQRLRARLEGYASSDLHALFAEMHTQVTPEVLAARVRMVFRVDAREALRACTVPALYVQASRDRVVPHWNAAHARRLLPAMEVVTIPSSHLVLQTCAAQSVRALMEFAGRIPD